MSEPSAPQGDFLPKLLTVLREGYGLADLRADAMAGLTVAIVALPLSMAIAIASGLGPERGLFTSIVGGFLISALGGSRYQIGGPAGAFIVGVSTCVAQIGVSGLMVATLLSGVLLIAAGALRLGHYVRFLPYPVTVGFSAGIAVIIFVSQIKDVLGLSPSAEPAEVVPKLQALWQARDSLSPVALGVALGTIVLLQAIKRWRPQWPNLLIVTCAMTIAVWALGVPVHLVGDRFGSLPHFLPMPQMPDLSPGSLWQALPFALQFTLLGAITGLLSAQVADGISGNRHRPSIELFAEGAANIAVSFIGGIYATGAVARTVTNHAAGSRGPVSGMLHAVYVLGFLVILAPLIAFVPMAVFAGILCVVAWNMAARAQFVMLLRASRSDGLILLTTFGLVVFRDLTEGIIMGFALAGVVFLHRMSKAVAVETDLGTDPDRVVVHLTGPWFFGAAAQTGALLDQLAERPKHFVLDMKDLDYLDSSGARALELLAKRISRQGGRMVLSGVKPDQRIVLETAGLTAAKVDFIPDLATLDRV
ncbi:SulP family inorganic anion transporter [Rhodobacter sp. KR11]|uniref:SulP family inorganic anion transporter n=1 Tax=Rhodobacter sp. KR11 TaxID=2974588 RepID=UPI0022229EF2|nr:SulP family inorganic anion transporter [Rhodobacter sp. KR11]MCW1917574.1 SulP family inorganic anion transporter [Rhodobacter sp. KR11]